MTEFYYNNEKRLLQLQEETLGDRGVVGQIVTPENLDVYKFLIAMSMEMGLHISPKAYGLVKQYAISVDSTVQNRVFFEKCDSYKRDILYFQNFMKEVSEKAMFCSIYYTYFHRAA